MASIQFWYCFRHFSNLQTPTGCPTFLLPSPWNQGALHHVFAERRKQDEENLCQQARSHGDKNPAAAQAMEGWTMTELIEMYFKGIQTETLFLTLFKDDSDCNSSKQFLPAEVVNHGEQLHGSVQILPHGLTITMVSCPASQWCVKAPSLFPNSASYFHVCVSCWDSRWNTQHLKLCTTRSSESCWTYPELTYTITAPPPILNKEVFPEELTAQHGEQERGLPLGPAAHTPERNQGQPGGQATCPGWAWGLQSLNTESFPWHTYPSLLHLINRTVASCFKELFHMVRREKINWAFT